MGGARLAALALAGSLAVVGLAPAAIAAPGAPAAQPTTGKSGGKKPAPKHAAPPKPPPAPCPQPATVPASRIPGVPWAQTRLDFIKVWSITRGRGVKVAVVDSGVNAAHPQLAGHVRDIDLTGTRGTDCLGHGTEVAGIIVAQDRRNAPHPVSFAGVAPDVQILSIKVQTDATGGDPALLAKGIRTAVQEGADIINVSAVNTDYPDLRSAVRLAEAHDVLIVAAAGNTDPTKKKAEQEEYPASYPSVLSVGAVGQDGLSSFSNTTSKVDVTAPGDRIISTAGDAYAGQLLQGTSFAAPYVAGVAALIKAYKPDSTAQQIKNRIMATADGSSGTGSGAGVVNPFQAVTAIGDFKARPTPSRQPAAQPIDIGGPPPVDHRARTIGGLVAVGTLGAALLVVFAGVVTPIGVRRGWRPGRAGPIIDDPEDSDD